MITVVTGCSRSGTSLVMKMLHKGGMDVFADNHRSYEADEVLRLPAESGWLDAAENKAIKILEPLHFRPPENREYRFIVMFRNPIEQAKSQIKFMEAVGFPVQKNQVKKLAKSIQRDMPKIIKMLKGYPRGLVLIVSFEALIAEPLREAIGISNFCGGLDAETMAMQVKKRSASCLPYLMELKEEAP